MPYFLINYLLNLGSRSKDLKAYIHLSCLFHVITLQVLKTKKRKSQSESHIVALKLPNEMWEQVIL